MEREWKVLACCWKRDLEERDTHTRITTSLTKRLFYPLWEMGSKLKTPLLLVL